MQIEYLSGDDSIVDRITDDAINCPAVSPINGTNMIKDVMIPESFP